MQYNNIDDIRPIYSYSMQNKIIKYYDDNALYFRYPFKLILVGDSRVGKTCMLSRKVNNNFYINSNATIGVEFKSLSKRVKIINNYNSQETHVSDKRSSQEI